MIDIKISQRLFPTKQGSSSLQHFDGATMKKYRYPSRMMEEVYCRNPAPPTSCQSGRGLDPEIPNNPLSELYPSETNEMNVCLIPYIPGQASYLGIESFVHSIQLEASTVNLLSKSMINCSSNGCRNQIVRAYKDSFGIGVGKVRFDSDDENGLCKILKKTNELNSEFSLTAYYSQVQIVPTHPALALCDNNAGKRKEEKIDYNSKVDDTVEQRQPVSILVTTRERED
jgi:hypothetical protein